MANFSPNEAVGHEGRVQGKNAKPLRLQGSSGPQRAVVLVELARLEGFEPPTNGFGSRYSIRLSYRRLMPYCPRFERMARVRRSATSIR